MGTFARKLDGDEIEQARRFLRREARLLRMFVLEFDLLGKQKLSLFFFDTPHEVSLINLKRGRPKHEERHSYAHGFGKNFDFCVVLRGKCHLNHSSCETCGTSKSVFVLRQHSDVTLGIFIISAVFIVGRS